MKRRLVVFICLADLASLVGASLPCPPHGGKTSPVELRPDEVTHIDDKYSLHFVYNDWFANNLSIEATSNSSSHVLKWKEHSPGGNLQIGINAAVGRTCELEEIRVHSPPEHKLTYESLKSGVSVQALEVQFLHHCYAGENVWKDRVKELKSTLSEEKATKVEDHKNIKEVVETARKRFDDAQSDLIASVGGDSAETNRLKKAAAAAKTEAQLAEQHKTEMVQHAVAAERSIDEDITQTNNRMENAVRQIDLEEGWHRVNVSSVVGVAMLYSLDTDYSTSDPLLSLLLQAGSFSDTAVFGFRQDQEDSFGSTSAIHYRGTYHSATCHQPVDWFVLDKVRKVSLEQLGKLKNKFSLQSGKLAAETSPPPTATEITRVTVDMTAMQELRYSIGELWHRELVYCSIGAVMFMVTLGVHAAGILEGLDAFLFVYLGSFFVTQLATLMGWMRFPSGILCPSILESLHQLGWSGWSWMLIPQTLMTIVEVPAALIYGFAGVWAWAFGFIFCGLFCLLVYMLPLAGLYRLVTFTGQKWLWPPVAGIIWSLIEAVSCYAFSVHYGWILIPTYAYLNGQMSCVDAVDWEDHVTFGYVVCLNSFVYLAICHGNMRRKGPFGRVFILAKFILTMLDMYTDCCFIGIALMCGTWHGDYALYIFVLGVLTFQWLFGVIGALCTGGPFHASWTAMLYPMECWQGPDKHGGEPGMDIRTDDKTLKTQILLRSLAQNVFEDFPQAYIQYRFTVDVKKNNLIVFSIATSVLTFLYNVFDACRVFSGASIEPEDRALVAE